MELQRPAQGGGGSGDSRPERPVWSPPAAVCESQSCHRPTAAHIIQAALSQDGPARRIKTTTGDSFVLSSAGGIRVYLCRKTEHVC